MDRQTRAWKISTTQILFIDIFSIGFYRIMIIKCTQFQTYEYILRKETRTSTENNGNLSVFHLHSACVIGDSCAFRPSRYLIRLFAIGKQILFIFVGIDFN